MELQFPSLIWTWLGDKGKMAWAKRSCPSLLARSPCLPKPTQSTGRSQLLVLGSKVTTGPKTTYRTLSPLNKAIARTSPSLYNPPNSPLRSPYPSPALQLYWSPPVRSVNPPRAAPKNLPFYYKFNSIWCIMSVEKPFRIYNKAVACHSNSV